LNKSSSNESGANFVNKSRTRGERQKDKKTDVIFHSSY
jgi:hypothetical protein